MASIMVTVPTSKPSVRGVSSSKEDVMKGMTFSE